MSSPEAEEDIDEESIDEEPIDEEVVDSDDEANDDTLNVDIMNSGPNTYAVPEIEEVEKSKGKED